MGSVAAEPLEWAGTPAATSAGRLGRLNRPLEGVRGLAVVAVVLYHLEVPGLGGGYLGVDVFFVLSGFVIGSRLAGTDSGPLGDRLWDFYARRVRRLLPLALLVVVVVVVGLRYALPAPLLPAARADAVGAATATLNIRAALVGSTYGRPLFGQFGQIESPFAHFWSLAVEEQFYLVVAPVALVVLGRWRRRALPLVAVGAAVSVALWLVLVRSGRPSWAFYLLGPRAWELLAGLALVGLVPRLLGRVRRTAVAGVAGWTGLLVGAAAVRHWSDLQQASLVPHVVAVAVGGLLVVASTTHGPRWGIGALLAVRPLVALGAIAYPLYLWHVPVDLAVGSWWPAAGPVVRCVAVLGVSLGAAVLTHVAVEQPLRFLPWAVSRPRATVLVGLAGVGAVVVAVVVLTSVGVGAGRATGPHSLPADLRPPLSDLLGDRWPSQAGCEEVSSLTPADCVTTVPRPRGVVAVVGDSHAHQWFPAVQAAATAQGFDAALFWRPGCTWFDVRLPGGADDARCARWRADVRSTVARVRPAVLVLGGFDGAQVASLGPERYRRAAVAELARVPSGVRTALLLDGPVPPFSARVCLVRNSRDVRRCAFDRDPQVDLVAGATVREVASQGGALLVDTVPVVCPEPRCPVLRGRTAVFRDEDHLTLEFARSRAAEIGRRLLPVLPPR